MGVVIVILIIAAIIGMIVWNRVHANRAMEGVEFTVPTSPASVSAAITAKYCSGAKAALKSSMGGLTVAPSGPGFAVATRLGDRGEVSLTGSGNSTVVKAVATSLYVGYPMRSALGKSSWFGLAARITHVFYKMIGLTPGATKMLGFQKGLEKTVTKQLAKQTR